MGFWVPKARTMKHLQCLGQASLKLCICSWRRFCLMEGTWMTTSYSKDKDPLLEMNRLSLSTVNGCNRSTFALWLIIGFFICFTWVRFFFRLQDQATYDGKLQFWNQNCLYAKTMFFFKLGIWNPWSFGNVHVPPVEIQQRPGPHADHSC